MVMDSPKNDVVVTPVLKSAVLFYCKGNSKIDIELEPKDKRIRTICKGDISVRVLNPHQSAIYIDDYVVAKLGRFGITLNEQLKDVSSHLLDVIHDIKQGNIKCHH